MDHNFYNIHIRLPAAKICEEGFRLQASFFTTVRLTEVYHFLEKKEKKEVYWGFKPSLLP